MFGLFSKNADATSLLVQQALGSGVAVVLSASCCMQGTQQADAAVEAVARAALQEAGLDWPVLSVTVTQAQTALGRIARQLAPAQAQLAQQVTELFATAGLGAFPVLLLNQRLVSYGGVPELALLRTALQAQGSVHETAA